MVDRSQYGPPPAPPAPRKPQRDPRLEQHFERLDELTHQWERVAASKARSAEGEKDAMGVRFLINGMTCYFNCIQELRAIIRASREAGL